MHKTSYFSDPIYVEIFHDNNSKKIMEEFHYRILNLLYRQIFNHYRGAYYYINLIQNDFIALTNVTYTAFLGILMTCMHKKEICFMVL